MCMCKVYMTCTYVRGFRSIPNVCFPIHIWGKTVYIYHTYLCKIIVYLSEPSNCGGQISIKPVPGTKTCPNKLQILKPPSKMNPKSSTNYYQTELLIHNQEKPPTNNHNKTSTTNQNKTLANSKTKPSTYKQREPGRVDNSDSNQKKTSDSNQAKHYTANKLKPLTSETIHENTPQSLANYKKKAHKSSIFSQFEVFATSQSVSCKSRQSQAPAKRLSGNHGVAGQADLAAHTGLAGHTGQFGQSQPSGSLVMHLSRLEKAKALPYSQRCCCNSIMRCNFAANKEKDANNSASKVRNTSKNQSSEKRLALNELTVISNGETYGRKPSNLRWVFIIEKILKLVFFFLVLLSCFLFCFLESYFFSWSKTCFLSFFLNLTFLGRNL